MSENTQKMNIVFCTDSGYFMPTSVCIASIIENNNGPVDFYVLYPSLKETEISFLKNLISKHGSQYSVKFIKIDEKTFNDLPIYGRSKAAYYRLLIPSVLPKDLDRCLYLDGDTVVYKSLEKFYNTSFENNAFVVNEDMGEVMFYHKERHSVLKIPQEYKYFNSGVLLFNLDWFKNFNMNWLFMNGLKITLINLNSSIRMS